MNKIAKEVETLEGTLEKIVFSNDETGFVVARLKMEQDVKLITITGILSGANVGDCLQLKGNWEIHPEFGQQFKVASYQAEQPVTPEGIIKYLSSSLIKGIGPKTAEKIVARWKEKSLDIIEKEPYRLTEIEGIGKKKAELIKKGWSEQKQVKNLMLFLHKYGLQASLVRKLHKQYGEQAYQIVKTNPYKLAEDIYGIGFSTADKIARKLGLHALSEQRIEAAIFHLLSKAAEEGHCFLRQNVLVERCVDLLDLNISEAGTEALRRVEDSQFVTTAEGITSKVRGSYDIEKVILLIEHQLFILNEKRKVIIVDDKVKNNQFLSEAWEGKSQEGISKIVYHPAFYYAEMNSAKMISVLNKSQQKALKCFEEVKWDKAFGWLSKKELAINSGIVYSGEQKKAIIQCLTNKITILTGGPGTGKSTITAALVKLVTAKRKKVLLAAPTGRAAKRLCEVTGIEAQTIHRLLEFSWQDGLKFKRNNDNPLETDLIIIDEASMLDIILLHNLLKAVQMDTHIIFIGDVDQLPSVGAGNVLRDMIDSERIPVIRLNQNFRQSGGSSIISNAHRIRYGAMPLMSLTKGDFFFFGATAPDKAANTVVELVTRKIPEKFGFSPMNDIQVLAPMHKGISGINELNRMLQNALNPHINSGKEIVAGSRVFRVNDRIIQLRNNYEKEVFNGDFGSIKRIDKEAQTLVIEFETSGSTSCEVEYDFNELEQITHSYAITIHKSQGSEFPVVVIPLTTQHYIMLQRNLFYTAITRAKKLVVIVGTLQAIDLALKNAKSIIRNTRLAEKIREGADEQVTAND